jgi:hypothetical protein
MFVTDNVALSKNLLSLSFKFMTMIKHKVLLVPLCDIGLISGEGHFASYPVRGRILARNPDKSKFLLQI